MSDFDLGLTIRADGSQAVAAGDEFAGSLDRVAAAEKRVGTASREAATGTTAEAAANKQASTAATEHSASLDRLAAELRDTKAALAAATAGNVGLASSNRAAAKSANDNAAAQNRAAFGARNLGQQVGDFATQVSLGGGVIRAFSSQIGQVGFALSEMNGRLGKVGAFLTGPWGIALTVAALALGPLIENIFSAGDEADAAKAKTYDFSNGLNVLTLSANESANAMKQLADEIRGAIAVQGNFLRQKALIANTSVGELEGRIAKDQARVGQLERADVGGPSIAGLLGFDPIKTELAAKRAQIAADQAALAGARQAAVAGDVAVAQSRVLESLDASTAATGNYERAVGQLNKRYERSRADAVGASADGVFIGEKEYSAEFARLTKLKNAQIAAAREVDKATGRKPKSASPAAARAATRRAEVSGEFGRDAQSQIDGVLARFDGTPALVREVNSQVAKLDDLIDDIGRKKPPGFEKLIADAERAKVAVQDGINQPYRDFIAAQERALANTQLLVAGRGDEAEAARIILDLERQIGPLTPARKDAVLATVQALRAEERQLDIMREKQQKYLEALGEIKSAVRGVVFDGLDGIANLPKRLIAAFGKLRSEEIFESLFGDVFRELEDEIKGTTIVEDASARMSEAIDGTLSPLDRLADAADKTASALAGAGGGPAVVDPTKGLAGTLAGSVGANGDLAAGVAAVLAGQKVGGLGVPALPGGAPANDNGGGDIVVEGKRRRSAEQMFGSALEKISKGIGISDEAAKKIGTLGGKAIAGAATGVAINSVLAPIGKALGFKTSKTGAAIGGAAGNIAESFGVPFGKEIGAVVGSVIGGLFKTTKKGYANDLTVNADGTTSYSTGGNSSSRQKVAGGLADSFGSSLAQVAEQLGGTINSALNLGSLGQKKDKFTFDATSGTSAGKQTFDTAEEAVAAALANAVGSGAIGGISAAMQKALQSSPDIDRAVSEALKVRQVEELIGGLGGELERTFRDFNKQASQYVDIARKYGLDVLAVERETAKARSELIEQTLNSQVGSLKSFLESLKYGDLAEGTPLEQRDALLERISTVQVDAEAGKDGAADELARLYQQLLEKDRDLYGTAGPEFANDRAAAAANAQRVIDMATKRINDAAETSATTVAAINEGNALANENNDLTAQMLASLNNLPFAMASALYGGALKGEPNIAAVTRAAA